MGKMSEIINLLRAPRTIGQKVNYIKYMLSGKGEKLSYDPVTISIVATTRCTLSCDMCPTHSSVIPRDYPHIQTSSRDMSFDIFKSMIDRFENATTVHIIGSGEPLLNKDFFRMVEYAAGKKMTVKTFSNGTTITANMDKILDSKLDGITISINGHNAEEFARITGMDNKVYCDICKAAQLLIEGKKKAGSAVKVKLSFIIDKYNYKFIPEMIDLGVRLDADHVFLCNFLPAPYDGFRAEERILMHTGLLAHEITAMLKRYPLKIRKKVTPPVLVDAKMKPNACETHFSQIRFDGDGNVSSCSMMLLNMAGHGNYRDADVWNNGFFRAMRRLFISRSEGSLPEPCRSCSDNKGFKIGGW